MSNKDQQHSHAAGRSLWVFARLLASATVRSRRAAWSRSDCRRWERDLQPEGRTAGLALHRPLTVLRRLTPPGCRSTAAGCACSSRPVWTDRFGRLRLGWLRWQWGGQRRAGLGRCAPSGLCRGFVCGVLLLSGWAHGGCWAGRTAVRGRWAGRCAGVRRPHGLGRRWV